MTPAQLQALFPVCRNTEAFAGPMAAAMARFAINTPERQAAFLAQVGHESAQLTRTSENLNYSAEGLMKTWPSRFIGLEVANQYAHQPEKIANRVYANRMHNGDEASGDGFKYRGSGAVQLTGKENHLAAALYFDQDLDTISDWLRTPLGACLSAGWFWECAGCNEAADEGDFDKVSDLINIGRKTEKEGDAIGYSDRLSLFHRAQKVLA